MNEFKSNSKWRQSNQKWADIFVPVNFQETCASEVISYNDHNLSYWTVKSFTASCLGINKNGLERNEPTYLVQYTD